MKEIIVVFFFWMYKFVYVYYYKTVDTINTDTIDLIALVFSAFKMKSSSFSWKKVMRLFLDKRHASFKADTSRPACVTFLNFVPLWAAWFHFLVFQYFVLSLPLFCWIPYHYSTFNACPVTVLGYKYSGNCKKPRFKKLNTELNSVCYFYWTSIKQIDLISR